MIINLNTIYGCTLIKYFAINFLTNSCKITIFCYNVPPNKVFGITKHVIVPIESEKQIKIMKF